MVSMAVLTALESSLTQRGMESHLLPTKAPRRTGIRTGVPMTDEDIKSPSAMRCRSEHISKFPLIFCHFDAPAPFFIKIEFPGDGIRIDRVLMGQEHIITDVIV